MSVLLNIESIVSRLNVYFRNTSNVIRNSIFENVISSVRTTVSIVSRTENRLHLMTVKSELYKKKDRKE